MKQLRLDDTVHTYTQGMLCNDLCRL